MKASFLALFLVSLTLSACHQGRSYSTLLPVALHTVPETFENPDAPVTPIKNQPPVEAEIEPSADEGESPNESQNVEKPTQLEEQLITALNPSTFIENTEWVMRHEGRRIGTPCNRFLQRVLESSGFSSSSFLANDFDVYARKYFRSYKAVDFKNDSAGTEITRLKLYLWNYPERTPFIMQWSRSGVHGHIAIVERIKDHLVIYQASLKKYTARKDQTTVQKLLSGFNRRTLTVYSEFKN